MEQIQQDEIHVMVKHEKMFCFVGLVPRQMDWIRRIRNELEIKSQFIPCLTVCVSAAERRSMDWITIDDRAVRSQHHGEGYDFGDHRKREP